MNLQPVVHIPGLLLKLYFAIASQDVAASAQCGPESHLIAEKMGFPLTRECPCCYS